MNLKFKTIAAAALLAGIAAGANAEVTVGGAVDAAVGHADTGGSSNSGLFQGVATANRLRFAGTEDLGGGLKASFALENGFAVDTGAQTDANKLFNREAYIGLEGGFGKIVAGRNYTPLHNVLSSVNAMGTGYFGNLTTVGHAVRADNSVGYVAPEFVKGLSVVGAYVFGKENGALQDSTANKDEGKAYGLSATYAFGKATVAGALTHSKNATGETDKEHLVGATYDLGVAKLYAAYFEARPFGGTERDALSLSVGAPLGNGTLMAQMINIKDTPVGAEEVKANVYSLAYSYNLSKRTSLYASWATARNDAGMSVGVTGAIETVKAVSGTNASGYAVGMKTVF